MNLNMMNEIDMIDITSLGSIQEPEVEYYHSNLTREIIGVCFEVYNNLGTGFLEIVYKDAIEFELNKRNILFEREKQFKIQYKDVILKHFYYSDFLIDGKVILEVKAQSGVIEENYKQLLNYLAASKCKVGLIVNFSGKSLQYKRVVL